VLTPHPLEAARLLGTDTADVQSDRLRAAQELARRFACVVVLKGSGTVIAAPDQTPRINGTGNAALATAGTGDVLAGWLGGCWTQHPKGNEPALAFAVARHAVAEHGAAAEPAPPGALRAGELIERLVAR
jgi:NAD(P)H-hydrate repair Nnr-like enzyme with NAD(P)H-hydrate dehydratase domain